MPGTTNEVCSEGFKGSLTDSSTAGAVDKELSARQGALPVVTFFSISPTSSKHELPAANVGR